MKFAEPYTHAIHGSYEVGDEVPEVLVEYLKENFPHKLAKGKVKDVLEKGKVKDKMERTQGKGAK